jgi:hypothetical protein
MHAKVALRVAKQGQIWQFGGMSMAELMREVANLPSGQQNELAAYLLHLRLQHDAAWRAEMTRRIDDHVPSSWVDLQDWKKELEQSGKE